ncbi:FliH/SctL family protein [Arthrobacter sp. ATA002]|uniref:FliH/SctL family protein n=1 Tax=Arthrobacter sp. ATA002 TaxID=2991715 RepID=UPI0022A74F39|nr:FliH/SctL family protein [Arthrobacter sp. ATA002]WAP51669.1 FliH/SctL family protein [Arthrobacter sp. ATA002]
MSAEPAPAYSRMQYPALEDVTSPRGSLQEQVRGHAAGYAAGLRAAAAETELVRSRLLAEHEAALAAGRTEIHRAVDVLNRAVRSLEQAVLPAAETLQHDLAAAAVELAEALLGQELKDSETSARAALARALSGVPHSEIRSVRLHPRDLAALDLETISTADVRLKADPMLSPGDAVTDFTHGYLDATLASAVERARSALLTDAR